MIHTGNSKSASDGKRKAHYSDFGPSEAKSKDMWNSPSHKVTPDSTSVSSNVPTSDMELKGCNFTFLTKGSINSQRENCTSQAAFPLMERNPLPLMDADTRSMPLEPQRWAIFLKGKILLLSDETVTQIKVTLTHVIGWFN